MTSIAVLEPSKVGSLENSRVLANRMWQRQYCRWLQFSDFLVVAGVVVLAQTLRLGEITSVRLGRHTSIDYSMVSATIIVLWVAALAISRTRSPRLLRNGLEESRRVLTATLSVFGLVAVFSTLLRLEIARGYLAIALPTGLAALLVNRWLARRYVARCRRRGKFVNAVLAVGDPGSVHGLAGSFARHPSDGLRLVGACDLSAGIDANNLVVSPTESILPCPDSKDIPAAVIKSGADTVVLTSGQLTPDEIRHLSWELEKLDVDLILSPGMVDVSAPRLSVWLVGGQPLIHVDKPQYSGAKRFQKRAFDIGFSMLLLIGVAPVMLLAALAVKLTSRGPVFYPSERVGLDGKPFRMIKFRSMVVDAEDSLAELAHLNESDGVLFKIRCDPRVTPVGRFLRRYSIDELPQFFNVLRGEMSVVGPRPPLPREADTYDLHTRRRLLVRPGITGLWQVSGRSDLSWEDSVRLDLSYVENWSMMNDMVIAASTIKAVFATSGAY